MTASGFQKHEDLVQQPVLHCDLARPRRVISIGGGIWSLKTANRLGYEFIGIGEGVEARLLADNGAVVYRDFDALLEVWPRVVNEASQEIV